MSDQYVTTSGNQYELDLAVEVQPITGSPTVQVNLLPLTQEVQIAGHKLQIPRLDVIQQLQAQVLQLTQELQTLKSKHIRLQQQHVNLAHVVQQLPRTSGVSASYD